MEDKTRVLNAVRKDGLMLKYFEKFQNDREVVLAAVQQNGDAISYGGSIFRDDPEVILAAEISKPGVCSKNAIRIPPELYDRIKALHTIKKNVISTFYRFRHVKRMDREYQNHYHPDNIEKHTKRLRDENPNMSNDEIDDLVESTLDEQARKRFPSHEQWLRNGRRFASNAKL